MVRDARTCIGGARGSSCSELRLWTPERSLLPRRFNLELELRIAMKDWLRCRCQLAFGGLARRRGRPRLLFCRRPSASPSCRPVQTSTVS
eukprot:scaffold66827_cov63-Phaeocystis_antarctica.AAC.3